jgi:long-subunit acyl-CoA synthetase (AMP-forming)
LNDQQRLSVRLEWAQLDSTVLAPMRAGIGLDQARVWICGSAPVAPHTLEFFLALGILITEVWGMSETAGVGFMKP